jgi:ribokinase
MQWINAISALTVLISILASPITVATAASDTSAAPLPNILVVGSLNVDIIIPVDRLPTLGETITARSPTTDIAVGGKGANQAVAAARLTSPTERTTRFITKFGNDAYAQMLETALSTAGVDVSGCQKVPHLPSGQGIVLLDIDGTASSVVLGGSNTAWLPDFQADHLVHNAGIVLLQREVPEHVNVAVAAAAVKKKIPVVLDVGGEESQISNELLQNIEYLAPNESELQRLSGLPTSTHEEVVAAASSLIERGVGAVLVTLAERGSVLVQQTKSKKKDDSSSSSSIVVFKQAAFPVPGGKVVDGTAAGDAFRAAFAVALVEGLPVEQCLEFAAAGGSVAVSRLGAVPSLPTRKEILELLDKHSTNNSSNFDRMRKGGLEEEEEEEKAAAAQHNGSCNSDDKVITTKTCTHAADFPSFSSSVFPLQFASRLNSMKPSSPAFNQSNSVLDWIALQGGIQDLDLIDLNYPQHFTNIKEVDLIAALRSANLSISALNVRFPEKFDLGTFTHPHRQLRDDAIQLCVDACTTAARLGASQLIVWSQYDGYDYNFQMNYHSAWRWTVEAYQHVADRCPSEIKISIEFKPTDENTRVSIVPSTGAAVLLAQQVNRPNFGLTLDVGHLLMAGENPAQSVALAAAAAGGKLFGMHLNDGHVKLGAEDGLIFGSVNPRMALELVFWLKKVNYQGHIYFDTFPKKENPVAEAELNIKMFKTLWKEAERLSNAGMDELTASHDAIGILELLNSEK